MSRLAIPLLVSLTLTAFTVGAQSFLPIEKRGTHNHNYVSLKAGFHSHLTEWPEHVILFYFNTQTPAFH